MLLSLGLSPAGSLAQEVLVPDPSRFGPPPPPLQPSFASMLFAQLEEGDRRLLPRLQRLPDGRMGVVYRRRRGDPPLSMAQLRAWMSNPPRWDREKATIRALLARLGDLGVRLEIGQTRQAQAAGEWLPRQGLVRIRPDIPLRGSQEFAKVLNHEAIHVAQSCRAGGVRRIPTLLGLQRPLLAQDQAVLELPIYSNQPPLVQRLEAEAFGLQYDLLAGPGLLDRFCGPLERQRIPSVENGRGDASRPADHAVLLPLSRLRPMGSLWASRQDPIAAGQGESC